MIYTNLIYFLVVIFVFSSASVPKNPWPSLSVFIPALAFILGGYYLITVWFFGRRIRTAADYFSAEKKLSLLVVFLFTICVYGLDIKYYLDFFNLNERFPSIVDTMGLAFYFLLLSIMWLRARLRYQVIFQKYVTPGRFIRANIKTNLPIVLPWLVISYLFDFLRLLPIPGLTKLLDSPYGDLVLISIFLVFLIIIFPPLVRRLWDCRPLPPGPIRDRLEEFCRKQNFSVKMYLWPLFEGRVLTAGIMGFIPGLRYLLLTPALLETLSPEEIEAVVAHEMGHVKNKHLLLYILLFLGFSLFNGFMAEPMYYLILNSRLPYVLIKFFDARPETVIAILNGVPVLLVMVIYFRFVFGYFIRNFERQADLHVIKVLGDTKALISAFETIAILSGNIRDQKSWHHFGIGERIDFLKKCEQNPALIRSHNRKLLLSMLAYFLLIGASIGVSTQLPMEQLTTRSEAKYLEALLRQKIQQDPDNVTWVRLLGDLLQDQNREREAVHAYEQALKLDPTDAQIMNNLAWLLLTARDTEIRNPSRALQLASKAASIKEMGYILDTLAEALWANGLTMEAIETEQRAMLLDPEKREYYRSQIKKFRSKQY